MKDKIDVAGKMPYYVEATDKAGNVSRLALPKLSIYRGGLPHMSAVAAIGPKLAVFLVAVVVGGTVMLAATTGLRRSGPVSGASEAPDFQLLPDDGGSPIAFDVVDAAGPAIELVGLPPADLVVAAETVSDGKPLAGWINPSGFPRISPVSQWDGGPFANANCTLAAGAMLARLGWGIVTSGSKLRTLQDDQVGGTGLDDLQVALFRGYGVTPHSGGIRPSQLKDLLAAGYGAVVQGVYGEIPRALRLQSDFVGPHAIFIDGYYPGDGDIPPAYFVIDPLAHRSGRYEGDWWPASIVDAFGLAFGSGGRIPAAWTFPVGGGSPPEVVGPDVLPIPPSGGDSPAPGASPDLGVPEPPPEAGDVAPFLPAVDVTVSLPPAIGAIGLDPYLALCLVCPSPRGLSQRGTRHLRGRRRWPDGCGGRPRRRGPGRRLRSAERGVRLLQDPATRDRERPFLGGRRDTGRRA